MASPKTPWYWTRADDAELDLLLWQLVNDYFNHRDTCYNCATGYDRCDQVTEAVSEVVEWRDARALLSKAKAFRVFENYIETAQDRSGLPRTAG